MKKRTPQWCQGWIAGFLAAQRLVHVPALELLTGRHEERTGVEPASSS